MTYLIIHMTYNYYDHDIVICASDPRADEEPSYIAADPRADEEPPYLRLIHARMKMRHILQLIDPYFHFDCLRSITIIVPFQNQSSLSI